MGKYTWPDGKAYEGSWENNKARGHGVLTLKDGKKIEGKFNQQ